MSNEIPKRQNNLVDLVRASREVYRRAKKIGGMQLGLSLAAAIGGPVIVAIVTYFYPSSASTAKAWVGLFAIAAVAIDAVFLEPFVKKLQEIGARIQERFDTQVYDLPWNRVKAGDRPDAGMIGSLVAAHKTQIVDDAKFLNWYPVVVGEVPMCYARLICQGSSMRWDKSLRTVFCRYYAIGLMAILFGSFSYAMANGYDMQAIVLSVFMPVLPAAMQVWREYKKNADAATDMERASTHLGVLWEGLLSGKIDEKESEHQARLLQDELFDRRRRAPAIPEQLYQSTRNDYEAEMIRVATEKVEEVKQKLGQAANTGANAHGP